MVLDNLTQNGKIGLGMFIAGAVFFTVGFSVPYWVTTTASRIGLWQHCSGDVCVSTVDSRVGSFYDQSWFQGTQALACLALIAIIVDLALRFLFLCGKPKSFLLGSIAMDCAACTLAILAAVVFGSKVERYHDLQLHFAFAFDIIGGVLLGFAAVFFLVDYCRRR